MGAKDELLRRTSPIRRSGAIDGFIPKLDQHQSGQQKATHKKRGRPPEDDEARVDQMVRLIDQGIAKSPTAASIMVAEKVTGQSVDSTARRLRRKYNDRIKWKRAGYDAQLFAIPNLPKPGIDILSDIAALFEQYGALLLGYGYTLEQAQDELKIFDKELFEIFPEIVSRLESGERWDEIKQWMISILYKAPPDLKDEPLTIFDI